MKVINKLAVQTIDPGVTVPLISVNDDETGFMVAIALPNSDSGHMELCDAVGAIIMTICEKFNMQVPDVMEIIDGFLADAEEMQNERMN